MYRFYQALMFMTPKYQVQEWIKELFWDVVGGTMFCPGIYKMFHQDRQQVKEGVLSFKNN